MSTTTSEKDLTKLHVKGVKDGLSIASIKDAIRDRVDLTKVTDVHYGGTDGRHWANITFASVADAAAAKAALDGADIKALSDSPLDIDFANKRPPARTTPAPAAAPTVTPTPASVAPATPPVRTTRTTMSGSTRSWLWLLVLAIVGVLALIISVIALQKAGDCDGLVTKSELRDTITPLQTDVQNDVQAIRELLEGRATPAPASQPAPATATPAAPTPDWVIGHQPIRPAPEPRRETRRGGVARPNRLDALEAEVAELRAKVQNLEARQTLDEDMDLTHEGNGHDPTTRQRRVEGLARLGRVVQ